MVSLNVRNLQINKKMLLTAPTEAYTVMKKRLKKDGRPWLLRVKFKELRAF